MHRGRWGGDAVKVSGRGRGRGGAGGLHHIYIVWCHIIYWIVLPDIALLPNLFSFSAVSLWWQIITLFICYHSWKLFKFNGKKTKGVARPYTGGLSGWEILPASFSLRAPRWPSIYAAKQRHKSAAGKVKRNGMGNRIHRWERNCWSDQLTERWDMRRGKLDELLPTALNRDSKMLAGYRYTKM